MRRVSIERAGSPAAHSTEWVLEHSLAGDRQRPRLLVVEDAGGTGATRFLARLARSAPAAGAWVAAGRCDARAATPLGPFPALLADVARALSPHAPGVLERHGMTLATLLAGQADAPPLAPQPEFRAGLADFALHGDAFGLREFFQGRNVSYRVLDDVVRLILDASHAPPARTTGPLLLLIDCLEDADALSLSVLRLLGRYAAGHSLHVVVAAAPGTPLPGVEWERVSLVPAADAVDADAVKGHYGIEELASGPPSLYARALQERETGAAGHGETALQASVAAWNLSAYPQALHHAAHAFADPACAAAHDADLFLALLHYEAGNARDCDTHLRAALERSGDRFQRALLQRLAGYNGVFGLKEHAYGLELLASARDTLRAAGRLRDVGWIQNAMAFALMNLRRPAEAMALEEESLTMARLLPNADRYLVAILQLNLGRLHRKSSLDDAVGYFRQSLKDAEGQVDPMLLLLFYITLGNLYLSHDRAADALSYYRRAADVGMDRDLGGFSDRLFALTVHVFPALVAAEPLILRVDAARLHLSLLMASAYRRLGVPAQALQQEAWVERELDRLGVEERPSLAAEAPAFAAEQVAVAAEAGFRTRLEAHAAQVSCRPLPFAGDDVARLLAAGESVAVLVPATDGVPGEMESLVLFDPRRADVRRRILRDLGRSGVAGGVVALPGAVAVFPGADEEFPCVIQEASLLPEYVGAFTGVAPVRTRVRFIPEDGGTLRRVLDGFATSTGVPFLAALALQVAGEEIAHDGALALKYFLETSIDHLLVDGLLVEKRHGPAARENFLPLRPRLLSTAYPATADTGGEGEAVLVVRRRRIRVGRGGADILPLCDGETPVERIVAAVGSGEEVHRFLHGLRGHNAIHYAS
jgi:tetratricopeptide (TPR) repeat protein